MPDDTLSQIMNFITKSFQDNNLDLKKLTSVFWIEAGWTKKYFPSSQCRINY